MGTVIVRSSVVAFSSVLDVIVSSGHRSVQGCSCRLS